jgi:hypothetical protein
MPVYSVNDVLDIIKNFNSEQKIELQQELTKVLTTTNPKNLPTAENIQSISGVNITGSSDIALNQIKAEGASSVSIQNKSQAIFKNECSQDILNALRELDQAISSSKSVNPLIGEITKEKIKEIQKESQKKSPDKNLIDHAVTTLKKGLTGIQELALPVQKVAELVANAWAIL